MSAAVSSPTHFLLARASQHCGWEGKACRTLPEGEKNGRGERDGGGFHSLSLPTLSLSLLTRRKSPPVFHPCLQRAAKWARKRGETPHHLQTKGVYKQKPEVTVHSISSKHTRLCHTTWDCLHCLPVDHHSSLVGQEVISRISNLLRERGKGMLLKDRYLT